jgi:hypothetical protein
MAFPKRREKRPHIIGFALLSFENCDAFGEFDEAKQKQPSKSLQKNPLYKQAALVYTDNTTKRFSQEATVWHPYTKQRTTA